MSRSSWFSTWTPLTKAFPPRSCREQPGCRLRKSKKAMKVQPNHVYIIPPNHNLAILHGILSLMPRPEIRGLHHGRRFLLSIARARAKEKAHRCHSFGHRSRWTQGLEAIKAEGGLAFVQDPISAKYDGMPHSAIASGVVDLVLTPKQRSPKSSPASHAILSWSTRGKSAIPSAKIPAQLQGDSLTKIFALLRNQSHVDFGHYKPTTIKRRIARRMVIHKKKKLEDYFSLSCSPIRKKYELSSPIF